MAGNQAVAAEFTAVLYSIHPSGEVYPHDTLTANLWVKGDWYRYEGNYKERHITIISNRVTDTSLFLDDDSKTFLIIERSAGRLPDPVHSWEAYCADQKEEYVGMEKIQGYSCHKNNYIADNGLWAEKWDSDSLGYFLKVKLYYADVRTTSVQLLNIKEQPVSADLFKLPKGYVDVNTLSPEEQEFHRIRTPTVQPKK
jgi:hypothetical protein